jgi:hypothetical protein
MLTDKTAVARRIYTMYNVFHSVLVKLLPVARVLNRRKNECGHGWSDSDGTTKVL